jgi:DNA-binding LacI/PurR family transcriptional regulator
MNVKPAQGKGRITFKDIAQELGVAVSTVSNAYNRPSQLSPTLREKVFETAKRLGYSGPNPAARGLRRGETGVIGLVYPDRLSYAFTDPAEALFIQGVAQEVEQRGLSLLLIGAYSLVQGVSPVALANVDGFVVHCFAENDPLFAEVLARDLPSVLVDDVEASGWPTVEVNDEAGAERAAEHLLELGHKRLGIVSLELDTHAQGALIGSARQEEATYRPTRARLRGYKKAAEQAGLEWNQDALVYESFENTQAEGFNAAATLLVQSPRPTGILAMSDQLALGVLNYAKEHGIRVPEDLSVIGYDDALLFQGTPALTTVRQPHIEKGRQAARSLLELLQGGKATSVTLETELIVRDSTGHPNP